jgi:hypothetical protein
MAGDGGGLEEENECGSAAAKGQPAVVGRSVGSALPTLRCLCFALLGRRSATSEEGVQLQSRDGQGRRRRAAALPRPPFRS